VARGSLRRMVSEAGRSPKGSGRMGARYATGKTVAVLEVGRGEGGRE
jgi:hypothetical protein